MASAFSSPRQAGAFALVLLVLLLLPALIGKSLLPSRGSIYSSLSWETGNYPFIYQQVFREKKDIDIAFVGSSHLGYDIYTPQVQKALSERLGRPAVVVSLSWRWHGMDALYFLTQELLRHRKVHLLVINDDCGVNVPHTQAWRWYRFADNHQDLAGLPLRLRIYYYYGAIVGMPRNLLNLLRPNLQADLSPERVHSVEQSRNEASIPTETLGAESLDVAFDWRADLFVHHVPHGDAQPSDAVVYSPATSHDFDFSGPSAPPLQIYFARKLDALAKAYHSSTVVLLLPHSTDIRAAVIHDSPLWPEGFRNDAARLGIPPAKLFSGLSDQEVRGLFLDASHLNQNGQEFYTPLITPSLIQLYESQTRF